MKLLIALGQTAFEWTWKTSLYASLLIVLVFVLQNVLAKWLTPRLRYTLSLLVLIRLLLPITPSSVLSFENLFPPAARLTNQDAFQPIPNPSTLDVTPVQQPHGSLLPVPAVVDWLHISVSGALCIVWASGCLCLLFLAGWRLGKWNGLIRKGSRISEPRLLELLNASRAAMRGGGPVELVAVAELSSPAVFGLFRVRLLLPETAMRQLNDEELRMIFLHEMAHVRRRDVLLNYLLMAVQFLHWFNPLVWLALHRLRADRELVCDAMVMERVRPEERLGYGKVLLKLMDGFSVGNPVFSGAVPVISSINEIKRRILMIKNHRNASKAACVTTALLTLALAFGAFTRASGQQQPTADRNAAASGGRVASHSAQTNHLAELTKPTISNLKEQLKNADYMVRVKALEDFGNLPTTVTEAENPALAEAVPILLQATKDDNSMVRNFAAAALWHIRSQEAQVVKALGSMVVHETDVPSACTAATALKDMGPAAALAVPDLMEDLVMRNDNDGTFLSHSGVFVKPNEQVGGSLLRAVIEALGNIGAPAQNAVPLLRKRLDVTGREALVNRVFSAKALWQITGETDAPLRVLMDTLQNSNSYWAADVLGMMGKAAKPAIPTLQSTLQSGEALLRLRSAIALNKIDPTFQVPLPLLQELLKDKHSALRFEAAEAMWTKNHDSQMILPTLLELLNEPNDRGPMGMDMRRMDLNYFGQQAIQLLGEIGAPAKAAVPRLKEIVQEKDSPRSSKLAAEALKKIEGDGSL